MGRNVLFLDCSYLGRRAQHTTGALSYEGESTGVIYGILRELQTLLETFDPVRIVFAFDSRSHKRRLHDVTYKENREVDREAWTDEKKEQEQAFHVQMFQLRTVILPQIGFKNIWWAEGFEADDLIASATLRLPRTLSGVIVSTDHDLYQLLRSNIKLYNPNSKSRGFYTEEMFTQEFGITPAQWPFVKAIAGCDGDNVKGIKGVGEKTAAKYLAGTLKNTTEAFRLIVGNDKLAKHNLPLVTLPYPGTPMFKIKEDTFNKKEWDTVLSALGFASFREIGIRKKK